MERPDLNGVDAMARISVLVNRDMELLLDCAYANGKVVRVSSAASPNVTYDLRSPRHAMVTAPCPTPPERQRIASSAR